jgi:hypothetical protein
VLDGGIFFGESTRDLADLAKARPTLESETCVAQGAKSISKRRTISADGVAIVYVNSTNPAERVARQFVERGVTRARRRRQQRDLCSEPRDA